jgi:hypothetical protein
MRTSRVVSSGVRWWALTGSSRTSDVLFVRPGVVLCGLVCGGSDDKIDDMATSAQDRSDSICRAIELPALGEGLEVSTHLVCVGRAVRLQQRPRCRVLRSDMIDQSTPKAPRRVRPATSGDRQSRACIIGAADRLSLVRRSRYTSGLRITQSASRHLTATNHQKMPVNMAPQTPTAANANPVPTSPPSSDTAAPAAPPIVSTCTNRKIEMT